VPNDLRADALLKDARRSLEAGKTQEARASLSQIVQQYPRTDAAAAATVALVTVVDSERAKVQKNLETVVMANRQQEARIAALEKSVGILQTPPPPAPVTVQAPLPAPAPVKKVTTAKKPAPKKPARRRRR
jgi:thioredoxin-like negative regulator of GroEL